MVEKFEFLADELDKFREKYDKEYKDFVHEKFFFNRDPLNKFICTVKRVISETKVSANQNATPNSPVNWRVYSIWALKEIFDRNREPREFIDETLDGLMIKLDEKVKEVLLVESNETFVKFIIKMPLLIEYEGGATHSTWSANVPREFMS